MVTSRRRFIIGYGKRGTLVAAARRASRKDELKRTTQPMVYALALSLPITIRSSSGLKKFGGVACKFS
jgi:hypothetical protein